MLARATRVATALAWSRGAHATAVPGASPALQALVERVSSTHAADLLPAPASTSSSPGAAPDPLLDAIRLGKDGSAVAIRLTPQGLGLAPRDAGLFTRAGGSSGPGSLPSQRATLATRRVRTATGSHRALILLRTEAIRAAIGADEAFIFPCRREHDTEVALASVREAVRVAAAATSATTPSPPSSSSTRLPFELAVLEALLAETVRQFERRHRQLRLVADGVADDVRRSLRGGGGGGGEGSSSWGPPEVGRLLPVAIALQEVRHDVREAAAAVAEVADSDAAISAVCLGDPAHDAHVAAAVLESYERQLETVSSAIRELEENTASLNAALAMGLDAHRNALMSLNAHVAILSASVAVCALPAAWFGMNVVNGLESAAGAFLPIAGLSVCAAAAIGGGVLLGWRRWPQAAAAARAADQQALRDLLIYHLDDLEDVLAAVTAAASTSPGSLSRAAFHDAVRGVFAKSNGGGGGGGRPIAADEMDLLFRVYDLDRDGFLQAGELARAQVAAPALRVEG